MAERLEIYKCEACGNIVEVLHGAGGELVCCGQPMKLYKENTVDAAKEKHVPVVEKTADGIKVKVGSRSPHGRKTLHRVGGGDFGWKSLPTVLEPWRGT
jgi:superoxide reductase